MRLIEPGKLLSEGDAVEREIARLGVLGNRVVEQAGWQSEWWSSVSTRTVPPTAFLASELTMTGASTKAPRAVDAMDARQ